MALQYLQRKGSQGMYGEQDGDGTPTLSADEQIRVSADHISDFVLKGNN